MTLKSLALFVGTAECNANCSHCAGRPLRKFAPKEDGQIDRELIYKTIKSCYGQGARSLSISSSGEPTLSPWAVTETLGVVSKCKSEGIIYSQINLYSNGIRIGQDADFCRNFLSWWKMLGLTRVYITVHSVDREKNAEIYGVKSYPFLGDIGSELHTANLEMRANLVLSKRTINTFDDFVWSVKRLKGMGVDFISAWPIRNMDDKIDLELSPLEKELDKIERWVEEQSPEGRIRLLREKSRRAYQTGEKLTLFPDGTLSNSWCNY